MNRNENPSAASPAPLVFLKLGGSLITDKARPHTPRLDVLTRLAGEIHMSWQPERFALLLGHGSGSFGHIPAQKYGTRQGVSTAEEWLGFTEVWREASSLNRIVMDCLQQAGMPALAFPPSAMITARDGQVQTWNLVPVISALQKGLLPVIYGDVVFDEVRGGTILSTEDLFGYLARRLHPKKLLLASMEPGVWADFPTCSRIIPEITPANVGEIAASLGGATAADVTGGMRGKVYEMLNLLKEVPALEISIFSGLMPGSVASALQGRASGTRLSAGD